MQEVVAQIPRGLSKFVGYAVKLIRDAILKLWDAFGEKKQREMQDQAKSWLKELLEKPSIAAGLLQGLYEAGELRKDISTAADANRRSPLHGQGATPPVSHQKRPNQRATNAIEFKRKDSESTNPIDILPLITVWLQIRVLAGHPPSRFAPNGSLGAVDRGGRI